MLPGEPDESAELLTFVIADIRGYTTFTQQRGDEAAARLTAKFAAIVRELVARFDGTVFELRGDEALCVFRSPRQSLRLAVALQQRFVDEVRHEPELPLAVGIGVDTGEAVRGADGYRGGALNLAARLCSHAKAGEVVASHEVTHLARATEGLRYVPGETVTLKGLADPVRLVRVLPDGPDPAVAILAALRAAQPADPSAQRSWRTPTRPKIVAATVAALVLVGGATAALVLPGGGKGTRLAAFGENSVGVLDTRGGRLSGEVGVDLSPTALADGFGALWSVNTGSGTVSRIDPASRHVTRTLNVGVAPSAIAVGLGALWVANSGSGTVSRVDPATGETRSIAVGSSPGGVTVAHDAVWVTNTTDGTVSRIDPVRSIVTNTITVGDSPSGITAGDGAVWVANSASNTVAEIDEASSAVTQTIHVGNDPRGVVLVGKDLWISNNLDGTIARIPAGGTSVADSVVVGSEPTALATAAGHIWVANQAGRSVAEVDPRAKRRVRVVALGVTPTALAVTHDRLWVATTINPELHKGGTVRLMGQGISTIDPAHLQEAWAEWLFNGTYDALVGYRHANGAGGTTLVADLATAVPEPTNGGRTYTFRLRPGIRWSTGAPVTVLDVRRGLERVIASGLPGLPQEVAGAASCTAERCAVSGIAVDPVTATITITLNRPTDDFLDLLTFAVAAPAGTPLGDQGRRPIPATGPYRVESYDGKVVVLVRNRYFRPWSAAAQPAGFPDRIEWHDAPHGNDAKYGADQVAAGRVDWADVRGADSLSGLQARLGGRLYVSPTETSHGIELNTRVAPFDDVRVRRALAYAVDRQAVADDWFTPAVPTCQLLPPNFPGHRPYCPYTLSSRQVGVWRAPDYPTAQRLVDESHTKGMAVTVWSPPLLAAGMRHVVVALNQLGYRARLALYKKERPDYFSYLADSRSRFQAAFGGWVADVPNAANFLVPRYACKAFVPASATNVNVDEFCDPAIDRLTEQAAQTASSSRAEANRVWASVDRHIIDAAPWIGLVTPSWVDAVSPRVHDYVRNSVLGVLFDQMWVR
jgi:YVTN family beta-propeller protein